MGDDQSDAKRRKISDLRAVLPFCSQTALAAICKEIERGGLPENVSRFAIWKETKDFLEDPSMTMYGNFFKNAEVTTVDNTKKQIIYINFLSLLSGTFHKGGAFTDFLLQLHSMTPSSLDRPWKCVIYSNEVHPGNILHSTSRKAWCIYISFLEFERFLSKSDCWFCIAICRSQEVGTFAAGISQLFRIVLEDIFADGVPETGVLLTSPKGSLRLHFTLSMILQDGAAHKSVWASRQDTGSKPCFLCKNLFQLRDESTLAAGGGNIFSKFLKYDQLQIATDAEVVSSWQRLGSLSHTATKKEIELRQQAAGLSYCAHALLSSERLLKNHLLRPVSLYCYDYMHGLCSHGVLNDMLFLVLESIHQSGLKAWDSLQSWMELWSFPRAYSISDIGKLFEAKAVTSNRKAGTFKCDASQVLLVYKPVEHFLRVMYLACNVMVLECQAYVSWARVLDYLVSLPFLPNPSPSKLLSLIEVAMAATVSGGFADSMKPKFHWCLHLADGLKRWSQLPSCWALERKHKQPRKFGSVHCKLVTYEKGLLSAVSMEHINTLVSQHYLFKTSCHLINPSGLTKKLEKMFQELRCFAPGMMYSKCCILQNGATCHRDDIVFMEKLPGDNEFWQCGQIKHFFDAAGCLLCLVDMFKCLGVRAGTESSKWQAGGGLKLVDVRQVLQAVIYSHGKDGSLTCLTPALLSCSVKKMKLHICT